MYMSPSNRSSTPNLLRCERKSRRYSGIGGNNAAGTGLKGLDAPASVAVASNRVYIRIFSVMLRIVVGRLKKKLGRD